MDDFVGEEYSAVRELPLRLVGKIKGKVDSVTEAELLGKTKSKPADLKGVSLALDSFDKLAVVIGDQGLADFSLEPKSTPYNCLLYVLACAQRGIPSDVCCSVLQTRESIRNGVGGEGEIEKKRDVTEMEMRDAGKVRHGDSGKRRWETWRRRDEAM